MARLAAADVTVISHKNAPNGCSWIDAVNIDGTWSAIWVLMSDDKRSLCLYIHLFSFALDS